jgi:hypothetical protein
MIDSAALDQHLKLAANGCHHALLIISSACLLAWLKQQLEDHPIPSLPWLPLVEKKHGLLIIRASVHA